MLGFVRRVYLLRVLGLGLGFFCVAAVLHVNDANTGSWILLAAYAFVWPHLAMAIVMRDLQPERAELRNLMIDSAMGGVWIAVMQFNLLPSALLLTMLLSTRSTSAARRSWRGRRSRCSPRAR